MFPNNQIEDVQVYKMTTALVKIAQLCMDRTFQTKNPSKYRNDSIARNSNLEIPLGRI
jgi:hypothetical protein